MTTSERRILDYLAANVRRHRLAASLTQAQLAEAIGVEPRFVRALESASAAPSFKTLVALGAALEVEVKELFEPAPRPVRNPGRPRRITRRVSD